MTALGGSAATPEKGLTAHVLVVHDMAELTAHAGQVHGNIVLFESRFDQRLADNGDAGDAYGQAGLYRFDGPSAAAKLGAAAALVRSVGGADFRLPHTGVTLFKDGQAPIPAAALAAEDADLVTRLAAAGPVMLTLLLTPKTLRGVGIDYPRPNTIGPDRLANAVAVKHHYGAPAVAVVTLVISIFTARRRWGFVIPVTALALLIADIAILAVTVAQ